MNYAEVATIRVTAVNSATGATLTDFDGRVELAENGTQIYTQNQNLGAGGFPEVINFHPLEYGVVVMHAISLAGPGLEWLSRPAPARITCTNYPLYGGQPLEIPQWVDSDVIDPRWIGGAPDWLEMKVRDIFAAATGDVATVLSAVASFEVGGEIGIFGKVDLLHQAQHKLWLNPFHNAHRVDLVYAQGSYRCLGNDYSYSPVREELRRTMLHEARHAYQGNLASRNVVLSPCSGDGQAVFDFQGRPANDSDLDFLVEFVDVWPCDLIVDSTNIRGQCAGSAAFSGDAVPDDVHGIYGYFNVLEHDAELFALTYSNN